MKFPWQRKATSVGPLLTTTSWGVAPSWTSHQYQPVAETAYAQNPIAHKCIRLISEGLASIQWDVVRNGRLVEDSELGRLLNRPNPIASRQAFLTAVVAHLLLDGNSFIETVGPNGRPPRELWPLRPDRMEVKPGKTGLPAGYKYTVGMRSKTWDADETTGDSEIIHIRDFSPTDDWRGTSRAQAAIRAIDRFNAAVEHNKSLLDNGARPSGALVFQPVQDGSGGTQFAPPEVLQAARQGLEASHGGPRNAGRPLVLGGSIQWIEMGITPKDMDFNEAKADAARDICAAFGVPHLLVVEGAATYNNIREAKLELYETTILPLAQLIQDTLNVRLAPRFGNGFEIRFDPDSISALEPRRAERRGSVLDLYERGLITREEAREELQFAPVPERGASRSPDPAIIQALLSASDIIGLGPMVNYLKESGLLPPGASEEEILRQAQANLEGEDVQ